MPNVNDLEEAPRKELHVFYVLDTSGSMSGSVGGSNNESNSGSKISVLNHCMEETVDALKDLAKNNADAKLKIAVLEFNSGCRWVTVNGPEYLEGGFIWDDLSAGGLTDIGAALTELNSKLDKHAFLSSMTGAYMPVIIFMTDGHATDNYEEALEEIRNNRWFRKAIKIGFAVGEDSDVDLSMIASIVGNSEAVIKTTDLSLFSRLMEFVSVTSSMLVSQSSTTKTEPTGATIVKMAKESGEMADKEVAHIPESEYNPEPKSEPEPTGDWEDDEDW